MAFTNLTPARAKDIDFSPPYLQIEMGFLVPQNSPAKSMSDIDKPGMRVAVLGGGTSDTTLTRDFKNAAILRALSVGGGVELLRSAKADAFGAQKSILFEMSNQLPGSRVLDDRFGIEHHAIGIPKGRDAGIEFIRAFALDARNSGLVKAVVDRAGLRGTLEAGD